MTEHSNDFLHLLDDKSSLSSFAVEKLGYDKEKFLNWRWHMKHQVDSPKDFKEGSFLLNKNDLLGFEKTQEIFKVGFTPYYYALMEQIASLGQDPTPIKLQAIPDIQELDDKSPKDPLQEKFHSPVREVVHLYPDRVAFCVAMLCPVYCRYCYRKRRDDEEGLHFNRDIIKRGIDYIAQNKAIKDVLVTGGDPFITSDKSLEYLLQQLRSIPHVEIIRFGTRTPVTLPYRVTSDLGKILAKYHPIWVNTHFNHPLEITKEAQVALNNLTMNGIPVGNQAVLLRGVNDSKEVMEELCRKLILNRVRPYYIFHPHLIEGTKHLRTNVQQGWDIMKHLRGRISGFGIPNYILDTPSGKVPINYNYVLGRDGDDLLVETPHGEIWREANIFGDY